MGQALCGEAEMSGTHAEAASLLSFLAVLESGGSPSAVPAPAWVGPSDESQDGGPSPFQVPLCSGRALTIPPPQRVGRSFSLPNVTLSILRVFLPEVRRCSAFPTGWKRGGQELRGAERPSAAHAQPPLHAPIWRGHCLPFPPSKCKLC